MLTVRNMQPDPAPMRGRWVQEDLSLLAGVALWAAAMLWFAWLGQPSDTAADRWYYVGNVQGGLL